MTGVMAVSSLVFLPGFMINGGRVGQVTLVLEQTSFSADTETISGTLHNGTLRTVYRTWGGMYSIHAWDGENWVPAGHVCGMGTGDVVPIVAPMRAETFTFTLAVNCEPEYSIWGGYLYCDCVPLEPGLHRIATSTSPRTYAEFHIV